MYLLYMYSQLLLAPKVLIGQWTVNELKLEPFTRYYTQEGIPPFCPGPDRPMLTKVFS